jgi:hypothetical protein
LAAPDSQGVSCSCQLSSFNGLLCGLKIFFEQGPGFFSDGFIVPLSDVVRKNGRAGNDDDADVN